MAGTAALGTTLVYDTGSKAVGRLTKIGGVSMTSEKMDVTAHDSTGGFKEYIAGLKEPGSVAIEGFMGPADAGQVEMLAHYTAGDNRAMTITYPDGVGGVGGSTWAFDAACTAFQYGEADVNGVLSFTAELTIDGEPVFTPVGGS